MKNPKRYPPEVIVRYRAQNFEREVVESVPVDLDYDEATLSCGHKQLTMPRLFRAAGHNRKVDCQTCAEAWLAKEWNESEQG